MSGLGDAHAEQPRPLLSLMVLLPDRKVEDLQFSVEEACIARGELEVDVDEAPTRLLSLELTSWNQLYALWVLTFLFYLFISTKLLLLHFPS